MGNVLRPIEKIKLTRAQRDLIMFLLSGREMTCSPPMRYVRPRPYDYRDVVTLAKMGFVTVEPKDKDIPPPPGGGFYKEVFDQEVVLTTYFLAEVFRKNTKIVTEDGTRDISELEPQAKAATRAN
jgi:hypothetical protein